MSEIKDKFSIANTKQQVGVVSIDCFLEIQNDLNEEKQKYRQLELKKNRIDYEIDDLIFKLDEAEMRNLNLENEIAVFRSKLDEVFFVFFFFVCFFFS